MFVEQTDSTQIQGFRVEKGTKKGTPDGIKRKTH